MRSILRALKHPPKRVDGIALFVSLISPFVLAAKAGFEMADAAARTGWNIFFLVAGAACTLTLVVDAIRRAREEHPHHQAAIGDVEKLIAEQQAE